MKTVQVTLMTKGKIFGWLAKLDGQPHGILWGSKESTIAMAERWATHQGVAIEILPDVIDSKEIWTKWGPEFKKGEQ